MARAMPARMSGYARLDARAQELSHDHDGSTRRFNTAGQHDGSRVWNPRRTSVEPPSNLRRTVVRMICVSTRGRAPAVSLKQAVIAGLAPDGGLYVPQQIPRLSEDWWNRQ